MLRGSLFLLFFFYIFSEWGMRKEIALPWLGLWLLGYLAFGMLHVTGVIISTVFFLHLLRMGHEKRDCIALIGLVIVGLQRAQTKIASAPEGLSATRVPVPTKVAGHWWFNGRIFAFHVGDPGPIPGQCKDSLLLSRMRACTISKNAQTSGAEAIFVWAQPWRDHSFLRCGYLCSETQETISVHKMALKRLPFISQLFNGSVGRNCSSSCLPQGAHRPKGLETKLEFLFIITWIFRLLLNISVEGIFCEWSVFLGTLLTAELHWNFKSRVNLTVYQHAVEGNAAGQIVSTFSLCGPCVTPSYLFSQRGKTELFYMWWDPNPGHDLFRVGPKQRSLQLLMAYQRLMRFEFEHFHWLCKPASTKCIGGIVASIAAFQAVDPASIPSQSFHKAWAEVDSELLLWHLAAPETFGWVVR